jgi:lysophospholipase L1-like esterase
VADKGPPAAELHRIKQPAGAYALTDKYLSGSTLKNGVHKNERHFPLFYRMTTSPCTFLALGDSYTIGEAVPLYESFPYQTVQLLRRAGKPIAAPEIIAKTGWTTDELAAGIAQTQCLPAYGLVSLLIGVNNQYRGRDAGEYGRQFEQLLQKAIRLAGQAERVFILSIPDWSVTPFAHSKLPDARGRTRESVAREIDAFNIAAADISRRYRSAFLDITEHTRVGEGAGAGGDTRRPAGSPFAADGLHPSGAEYRYWAEQLAAAILEKAEGQ